MDVYIPLALYIIAVSIFFREHKRIMLLMVFIPLLLFWGTREEFGADYFSYKDRFEYQHEWGLGTYIVYSLGGKFEPGFFLLMKLMPDYNSLVFICSLFYIIVLAIFFFELIPTKYYPLAFIMLLFCSSSFNAVHAIRSSITLGLFLLACIAKMKGHMKAAVTLVLISGTFHMSGFLLLLLLLPKNETLNKHYELLSIVTYSIFSLALLIPNLWASLLHNIVGQVDSLKEDYQSYIYERSVGIGFYLLSLLRLGFIIYILSLLKRKQFSGFLIWFAWVTILYYILQVIQNVEIIYRFSTYLYFVSIIFKCYILKVDKTVASKLFVGISIIYTLFNFYSITMNPLNDPTNQQYHSFLF